MIFFSYFNLLFNLLSIFWFKLDFESQFLDMASDFWSPLYEMEISVQHNHFPPCNLYLVWTSWLHSRWTVL